MFEQRNFANEAPPIINASEAHMACLLLLDTSISMAGAPIEALNSALNQFKAQVCEDKATRSILDVAIVEFNTDVHVVQPFVPVEQMMPVSLQATGVTNMAPAIETAIEMVRERTHLYRRVGSEPYKPWIVLISDGGCSGLEAVAAQIHEREDAGKLNFFSLGVEGYDSNTLHLLSRERVMKLHGYDFTAFFNWVGKSMASISQSSPGERPQGVPLPDSVDKDTSEWM